MLQYVKIDVSEEIHVHKTSLSKECILCHYWYFENVGFRFEPQVCDKCQDVLMTAYEFKNIESVGGVDFRCILWGITSDEAVNRLNNSVTKQRRLINGKKSQTNKDQKSSSLSLQ